MPAKVCKKAGVRLIDSRPPLAMCPSCCRTKISCYKSMRLMLKQETDKSHGERIRYANFDR